MAFGCTKYNSLLVIDICGEQTDRTCLVYSLLDVLYDNSFIICAVCWLIGQKINNTYHCILCRARLYAEILQGGGLTLGI